MTLLGIAWLLAFFLVFLGLLKVTLWLCLDERPAKRAAAVAEPAPAALVPDGWSVGEYAADGIRGLKIMLIQAARDSQS